MGDMFLINLFKAFFVLGGFGIVLGFLGLIVAYFIDSRNIRENYGNFSTTLGNALFIIQNIFEPQAKFRTEQVIWVKKRRTPAERMVSGLSELHYDKISIRGIKSMKNRKFYVKSGF
ncbi:hypothetical protein [Acetivibrio cellulolyticus]|uniref:hypothetical protein n=1 Tax=Acetivibrio cellulolyticus TaxID=35830 RepID=UPI0001E2E749|nr:hypothetical protein [Acetivibrio cellulolyticus]